jgi:hypothetical protein
MGLAVQKQQDHLYILPERGKERMTMFYEWVAEGAAFGIKAFSALFVFALICAACLGIWGLLSYAVKGGAADDREEKHRPY